MSSRQTEFVERLGQLAAMDLHLSDRPDHQRPLEDDLEQMVAFVSVLKEFDDAVNEDDPLAMSVKMAALRGDNVRAGQTAAEALAHAPEVENHCFSVPLMVG